MRPARGRPPGSSSSFFLLGILVTVFAVTGVSFLLLATHPHHAALQTAVRARRLYDPPTTSCGVTLPDTELGGDVVSWGANHKLSSADACCAACASADGCNGAQRCLSPAPNARPHFARPPPVVPRLSSLITAAPSSPSFVDAAVWVFCDNQERCGEHFQECWLKKLPDPWEDVEALRGKSGRWMSGVRGKRPDPAAGTALTGAQRERLPPEVAVVTEYGEFRVRLLEGAPLAAEFVRAVARAAPRCAGCRFYRAEPVPPNWGSLDAPDSWDGGRWGPPYALLQGSFMPAQADGAVALPKAPPAELERRARPLITRGMIAWAGGGGGPDGFVALADHPEWGHGHTVWGEVVAEDMGVVDKFMRARPIKVENWGSINASVFVQPLPFSLRSLAVAGAATAAS